MYRLWSLASHIVVFCLLLTAIFQIPDLLMWVLVISAIVCVLIGIAILMFCTKITTVTEGIEDARRS